MNIRLLAIVGFLAVLSTASSQTKSSEISKEDSLQIIQELAKDLAILFGDNATPQSYFNFRVGVGNANFTTRNTSSTGSVNGKLFYSASGAYNHKSGLSLNVTNLMIPENESINLFQTAVSPSYDYLRSKTVVNGSSISAP